MGERIGDYRLLTVIGTGATATVYEAVSETTGQAAAIKVFHAGLWNREDVRKRALAEVEAIRLLEHANILKLREARLSDARPSVVLELVAGRDLESFQARLPYVLPELGVLFVLEILEALSFAHARGVVHRDLKPSNVLIDEKNGRVVVSDFGLARMQDASSLTLTGTLVGSPDYMAPEQAQGADADHRSDLFSVSAILYFLVTGTRPFARSTPLATLAAVTKGDFESPEKRNPKISRELVKLIRRGLAVDPALRFASAEEMREALRTYLRNVGLGDYTLTSWFREPTEFVYAALGAVSRSLVEGARLRIARREPEAALETLSHLSAVSSAHPELAKLLSEAHRQIRRRKIIAWRWRAAGASTLLLLLTFVTYSFWPRSTAPVEVTPVAAGVPRASLLPVSAPAKVEGPNAVPPKLAKAAPPKAKDKVTASKPVVRKETLGTVRFEVGHNVKVTWNRRSLRPDERILRVRPGAYPMKLERPGSQPIETQVEVSLDEPVVIRAR